MVGIEPAEKSVRVAVHHASKDPLLEGRLKYECTTLEEYISRDSVEQADLVVASEVIEHVSNPPLFVSNVTKLIKVSEDYGPYVECVIGISFGLFG